MENPSLIYSCTSMDKECTKLIQMTMKYTFDLYMIMYLCLYCMYVRLITNSISLFVSGAILRVDWLSGFCNKKV